MGKTISVGQLRQNPTSMIREVQQGAVYTLTDRGRPVADIAPHRGETWRPAAEVDAVLRDLGPDPELQRDIADLRREATVRDPWGSGR